MKSRHLSSSHSCSSTGFALSTRLILGGVNLVTLQEGEGVSSPPTFLPGPPCSPQI